MKAGTKIVVVAACFLAAAVFFAVALYLVPPSRVEVMRHRSKSSSYEVIVECRRVDGLLSSVSGIIAGTVAYLPRVCLHSSGVPESIMEHSLGYSHDTLDSAIAYVHSAHFDESRSVIIVEYEHGSVQVPVLLPSSFH